MNGLTRWVALIAAVVIVQGCANNVAPENLRAYAIAAGFLTLCDDGDFDYALEHFGRPLKATAGTGWSDKMQKTRGAYGLPLIRSLVSRDSQKSGDAATDSAGMNFVFRTSFIGTTPGEESVSVERLDGRWQVYDYQFRPSGKPPETKGQAKIKKSWETQSDDDE